MKIYSDICWSSCDQLAPVDKGSSFLLHKWTEHFTLSEWIAKGSTINAKLFIGALKKNREKKDNQYKLKEAMAMAIDLIDQLSVEFE